MMNDHADGFHTGRAVVDLMMSPPAPAPGRESSARNGGKLSLQICGHLHRGSLVAQCCMATAVSNVYRVDDFWFCPRVTASELVVMLCIAFMYRTITWEQTKTCEGINVDNHSLEPVVHGRIALGLRLKRSVHRHLHIFRQIFMSQPCHMHFFWNARVFMS